MNNDDFLDRHDRMARLNNRPVYIARTDEDFEQINYIRQWHIDHPNNGHFGAVCVMIIIAIVGCLASARYIRQSSVMAPPQKACVACHYPSLTSYSSYRKYHKTLRNYGRQLLAELARP